MTASAPHRSASDRLAVLVGTFGMAGFFPIAPATFASAVAVPVIVFAYRTWTGDLAQVIICAVILVAGVWSSTRLERLYGKDPSAAVIDEVLGMAVALAHAPLTPFTLLLAFVLFRILDVVKLPPGRLLERLRGGWGVMLDDLSAGIYASAILQLTLRVWPEARLEPWHAVPLAAAAILLAVFRKPLLRRYGKKRCDPRVALGAGEPRP